MAVDRSLLLVRLKRAVKKIKFLLDFKVNRWKLASIIGGRGASSKTRRRLSMVNNRPGLTACVEDEPWLLGSAAARSFHRTISCPLSDQEDIDKKADAFIANFHKQLHFERQISLELRYYRGNSFDS